MKTATIPALRVEPELRHSAEDILYKGETLSSFVIESLRQGIKNRQLEQDFINKGLVSRDQAKADNEYYDAKEVLIELKSLLDHG